MLTQYAIDVRFVQKFDDSVFLDSELAVAARIVVVVKKPTRSLDFFPKFTKSSYEFEVAESVPLNSIARNVTILIHNEYLTDFTDGFGVELLNRDLTPASTDIFELVPNYGVGFLLVTLKVKSPLDYEKGIRKFDYVVSF